MQTADLLHSLEGNPHSSAVGPLEKREKRFQLPATSIDPKLVDAVQPSVWNCKSTIDDGKLGRTQLRANGYLHPLLT